MNDYTTVRFAMANLGNIPRNISEEWGKASGKILFKDGTFLLYSSLVLTMDSVSPSIDFAHEKLMTCQTEFDEIPCDQDGNPLLISYWVNEGVNLNSSGKYFARIFILCSEPPTNRINLSTGVISSNDDDNNYIKNIMFRFTIIPQ
ncbi:hypothetical protein [Lelliottia nimipressuralis]|uniref:Uncharacterized protein n=1 Tax=Lelliottia nimipressuralis TaxID=69220 RepID=A0ABD4KG74_9ENTR|nr:hypothetical protein [Lelliottia nimipressuralis]MBF4180649.1 hypothetical protein [Lelliottia nimipressuralis]